jgi:two-component system, NarL family, nitrate/nitrite response regulator NarL
MNRRTCRKTSKDASQKDSFTGTVAVIGAEEAAVTAIKETLAKRGRWDVKGRIAASLPLSASTSPELPTVAVILLNLRSSKLQCINWVRKIRTCAPELPIVALVDSLDAHGLSSTLIAGATALLVQPVAETYLAHSVAEAAMGRAVLCPKAQSLLIGLFHEIGRSSEHLGITPREREILECLLRGLSDKEIAKTIEMCSGTVHAHLRRIYQKFKVHKRRDAAERYSASARNGGWHER